LQAHTGVSQTLRNKIPPLFFTPASCTAPFSLPFGFVNLTWPLLMV